MTLKSLLSLALLALLASCGPPQPYYQTDFQFIPPTTEAGRMCVNQCIMGQQQCQQTCNLQQQSCRQTNLIAEQNAAMHADYAYENYVRDRKREGKLIKKDRSDFLNHYGEDCSTDMCESSCAGNFQLCYSNCGGQVIPRTVCVSNCHLIPPAGGMTPAQLTPAATPIR